MSALPAALRRITLNSLWLVLGRVLGQGLTVIFGVVLARALGAEGLGRYAVVTGVVFLANTLTTFGTDTLIIRETSRLRTGAPPSLAAAMAFQLGLSMIVIALILASSLFPLFHSPTLLALRVYSIALIPLAVSTVYSALLRGHGRMDLYTLFTLVTAALQTGGGLAILSLGGDLVGVLAVLVFAHTGGALTAAVAAHTIDPAVEIQWKVKHGDLQRLLAAGLPLVALMGLSIFYQRMGVFILVAVTGEAAAGWFSAAGRMMDVFRIAPYAVFGALFPAAARAFQTGLSRSAPQPGNPLADVPTRLLLAGGLAIALMVSLLAGPLVGMVLGRAYGPSVGALRVLAWSFVPYVAAAGASLQLVASNRERALLRGMAIIAPVAALLHLALTAGWGLIGAAWAAAASEVIQAAMLLYLVRTSHAK